MEIGSDTAPRAPWNNDKLVGQKAPLKPKDIWAIRVRLQMQDRLRDLALFNLAIDSKPRGCDLIGLHVRDISPGYFTVGSTKSGWIRRPTARIPSAGPRPP